MKPVAIQQSGSLRTKTISNKRQRTVSACNRETILSAAFIDRSYGCLEKISNGCTRLENRDSDIWKVIKQAGCLTGALLQSLKQAAGDDLIIISCQKYGNAALMIMHSVIETPIFTKRADALLIREERAELIRLLAENPRQGDVIPGTGGVRNLRFAEAFEAAFGSSGMSRVTGFLFMFC